MKFEGWFWKGAESAFGGAERKKLEERKKEVGGGEQKEHKREY